jgi:hypothetical protein
MNLRYYHNPATDQPHIYDHGVSEDEVEEVLRNPAEDARSRGQSRVAIGQTQGGRYLKVIYVADEIGDGIFVVTAYDLVGKGMLAFRRRMRRRRQ